MPPPHRSAGFPSLRVLGCFALTLACARQPPADEVVSVRVRLPPACASQAGRFDLSLEALGDFAASPLTAESVPDDGVGVRLRFPERTRAITATAQGGETWSGLGLVNGSKSDILLLPREEACVLSPPGDYPTATGGEALGLSQSHDRVLIAGALVDAADAARAAVVDLERGEVSEVEGGMLPGRAFASITPFGPDGMLVAGGVDPGLSGGDLTLSPPLATAIRFDLNRQRFDRERLLQLSRERARHAALILDDGSTLLVGGMGATGLPLSTLEVVSPLDGAARVAGLATLTRARSSPSLVRLADGRIAVVGGVDALGASVPVIEWLSADASELEGVRDGLAIADEHAFVAMPGGGMLAVGVCDPNTSTTCSAAPEREVAWISADGSFQSLAKLGFAPVGVLLLRASEGRPWLISGASGDRNWRRFDPWTGEFVSEVGAPRQAPEHLSVVPDTGSLLWLARDGKVMAWRHGLRGPFARDVAPLLLGGPQNVVPTRAPLGAENTGVGFGSRGLEIRAGAEVWIADTTYADVSLVIDWRDGPAPSVLLGDQKLGEPPCAWPVVSEAEPGQLEVARRGATLTLQYSGQTRHCPSTPGRHRLGLTGRESDKSSILRSLTIRRGGG